MISRACGNPGLSPIYLDTSKTGADPKKFVEGIPGPLDFDF